MSYFLVYLAIGVLVLLFNLFHKKKKDDFSKDYARAVYENIYPERKRLGYRFLYHALIPALAGLTAILVWPLAIHAYVKAKRQVKLNHLNEMQELYAHPEIVISQENLLQEAFIRDIEEEELVFDPLGAAPNLPFGHLNSVWLELVQKIGPGDTLWTFEAPCQNKIYNGIVIVREGIPGSFFLTACRDRPPRILFTPHFPQGD